MQERSSSSVCKEMMARAWTLDTNAREAKERLDQKLEGKENLWSRGVCVAANATAVPVCAS